MRKLFKCLQGSRVMMPSIVLALGVLSLFYFTSVDAQSISLGDVATNVTKTFGKLAKMITAVAYIAGLGFSVGAIMKFKQHKDNPTQIPIGTPVAMLFIAAALIFLPTIMSITGQTIFGTEGKVGGPSGYIFKGNN